LRDAVELGFRAMVGGPEYRAPHRLSTKGGVEIGVGRIVEPDSMGARDSRQFATMIKSEQCQGEARPQAHVRAAEEHVLGHGRRDESIPRSRAKGEHDHENGGFGRRGDQFPPSRLESDCQRKAGAEHRGPAKAPGKKGRRACPERAAINGRLRFYFFF